MYVHVLVALQQAGHMYVPYEAMTALCTLVNDGSYGQPNFLGLAAAFHFILSPSQRGPLKKTHALLSTF